MLRTFFVQSRQMSTLTMGNTSASFLIRSIPWIVREIVSNGLLWRWGTLRHRLFSWNCVKCLLGRWGTLRRCFWYVHFPQFFVKSCQLVYCDDGKHFGVVFDMLSRPQCPDFFVKLWQLSTVTMGNTSASKTKSIYKSLSIKSEIFKCPKSIVTILR